MYSPISEMLLFTEPDADSDILRPKDAEMHHYSLNDRILQYTIFRPPVIVPSVKEDSHELYH